MYRFLIVLLTLIVAIDVLLLSKITDTSYTSVKTGQLTNSTSIENWLTYDGGTWSIKHPSLLVATNKNIGTSASLNLISFGGFKDGSTLTVHASKISSDPLGEMVLQRDPLRLVTLETILDLEKEALQGVSGQKLLSAQKIIISNSAAVEFVEVDLSNPTDITYSAQTTFVQADSLAFVGLFTSHSPQPAAQTEQIYNAMLESFRFK